MAKNQVFDLLTNQWYRVVRFSPAIFTDEHEHLVCDRGDFLVVENDVPRPFFGKPDNGLNRNYVEVQVLDQGYRTVVRGLVRQDAFIVGNMILAHGALEKKPAVLN